MNATMAASGDMLNVNDIVEILAVKLIGVVPDDKGITVSTNKGEPIVLEDSAISGKAFKNIARRILGEEVPFLELKAEEKGFLASIKKIFSK